MQKSGNAMQKTADEFKTGYVSLAVTLLFLLFVDLILNAMVDTDDFEAISRKDCAKGTGDPNAICLDVPIAIYGYELCHVTT
jgi:hypothetical protein